MYDLHGRCIIYFYLEDESVHVAEPKQQNSGIPQVLILATLGF
jgi:hypothetical protein